MAQQPSRQPIARQPQTPIEWTDEDLQALADIKPTDLKTAIALWKQDVPPAFKELLAAEVIEVVSDT
jgi:hypothetical protein